MQLGLGLGKKNIESVQICRVLLYTYTANTHLWAFQDISSFPHPSLQLVFIGALPTYNKKKSKSSKHGKGVCPGRQLLQIRSGPLISSNTNKTVENAMAYLKQASILHLACHGHQDHADPLNSGFELNDGHSTSSVVTLQRHFLWNTRLSSSFLEWESSTISVSMCCHC